MAARLPQPGSDKGQWGDILNTFLLAAHTNSGALKSNIVATQQLQDAAVSEAKLAAAVVTKLNASTTGEPVGLSSSTMTTLSNTYANRVAIAAPIAASGALVTSKVNQVNASSATVTMSLPTGQREGSTVSIEKVDASTHPVVISGSIRGANTTINLTGLSESIVLVADSAGSWHPFASHRTKAQLDAIARKQSIIFSMLNL